MSHEIADFDNIFRERAGATLTPPKLARVPWEISVFLIKPDQIRDFGQKIK